MLLGIALHAIISFMGEEYWPVRDTQSPAWAVPHSISESGERMGMALPEQISPYKFGMQAIHGFRMPLFFLVSGFFTAMLWRSRGMKELLKHRVKRILLPLAAAGAVIIPATWGCMIVGGIIANGDIRQEARMDNHQPSSDEKKEAAKTEENEPEKSDGDFVEQIYEDLPGWGKVAGVVVGVIWGLSMVPIFHHLWFLFYLVVMVLLFAGVVWLAGKFKLREWPAWVVASPVRWLWLLPLTFLAQVTMWQSFGPDTHTGFIPWPPKVLYYFVFFGFGALCFGRPEFEERAGRLWPLWFLCAVPFLLVGFGFWETRNALVVSDWRGNQAAIVRSQLILSACAVVYTWLMIFGLIGLFRKCFSIENKTIRYISDSSYWLYLAHLPVIFLLQGLLARWEAPSLLKCFLICALTVGGLLVIYDFIIRYTFIGTMLNGKRTREKSLA